MITGKRYRGMAPEHAAAKAAGLAPFGIFRTAEGVFSGSWEREFPGCYHAGQGGVLWEYRAATPEETEKAKEVIKN